MIYRELPLSGGQNQGLNSALSPRQGLLSKCYSKYYFSSAGSSSFWSSACLVSSPLLGTDYKCSCSVPVGEGEKGGCLILLQLDTTSNENTGLCCVASVSQLLCNTTHCRSPKRMSSGARAENANEENKANEVIRHQGMGGLWQPGETRPKVRMKAAVLPR